MNKFKITTDNEGFNKMVEASLLSIARRQDRHSTGAIPESDLDVDNGFSYKFAGGAESATYTRSVIGHALVRVGMADRLCRFLEFYAKAQCENGQFETAMQTDVAASSSKSGLPLTEGEVAWLRQETDTTAYVVLHAYEYYSFTRDTEWLERYWPVLRRALTWLETRIDLGIGLPIGLEEAILDEDGKSVDHPVGFMRQICGTVALSFQLGSWLSKEAGDFSLSSHMESISLQMSVAMEDLFWEDSEGRYFVGASEQRKPFRNPMFYTVFPAYLRGSWGEHDSLNFRWLLPKIFDCDPLLPGTLHLNPPNTHTPAELNPYSGAGAFIGQHPIAIELLWKDGQHALADKLLQRTVELTDDTGLIAEHINTICLGRELAPTMQMWPHPTSYIDRGNLMHLSFFLKLVAFIVGVKYRDDSGVVQISPVAFPCLGTIRIDNAPLPGGGGVSFTIRNEEGRTLVSEITVEGEAVVNIDAAECHCMKS